MSRVEGVKDGAQKALNKVTETAAAAGAAFMQQNTATQTKIITIIIVVTLIIAFGIHMYSMATYRTKHCNMMSNIYTEAGHVASIDTTATGFADHPLRDYYIKTAYNCCAINKFKNTYVDTCALKEVIGQGVRALDFQIFSVDNLPVISVSSISCDYSDTNTDQLCYNIKESYNTVNFADAMSVVADYAFNGTLCPNPNDPLILHLRINSTNNSIYSDMTDILKDKLSTKLLGKKYSYEYNGDNFAAVKISNLVNKVIIIVDKSNPHFEDTPLKELVNICSNSVYMRALREYDVKNTPDFKELTDFNRNYLTMALPDVSANNTNPSPARAMSYGVQMTAMCYQNYDEQLDFYETFFRDAGHAFVLKPESLHAIPLNLTTPEEQTVNVNESVVVDAGVAGTYSI